MRIDVEQVNLDLADAPTPEILRWAVETFGPGVAATSSFQTQSLPLLHMIATHAPALPVFFLDTGFHFPETLAYRDQLVRELGLNVRSLAPALGHEGFRQVHGELYRRDPDRCCHLNKVEPLEQALKGHAAWVTGIRRDQTSARGAARVVSLENGAVKVCPMLAWTEDEVLAYIREHALPVHPMLALGYRSIGCAPCTAAVKSGEDARAGRWAGLAKTECGLHSRRSVQGS